MKNRCLRFLAPALLLVAMAATAYANVVVVSPSNLGDWSWMYNTIQGGPKAYFTKSGPAPAEGNPFPTGNGAFCAMFSYNGETDGEQGIVQTPDTAWLGLDRHNNLPLEGITLDQITKLEYVVYNGGVYVAYLGGQIRYSKQPFQLTITVECPTTGDRRQFIFRPWGKEGWPHWNNRRAWLTLDAINMQSSPNFGNLTSVWYEATTNAAFNGWYQILNTDPGGGRPVYAYWTLVPTSTYFDPTLTDPHGWKSAGWDSETTPPGEPRTTGTGKPFNLTVGARRYTASPYTTYESLGFKGYVDSFTLGINYAAWPETNIVETTYDFASDDPAPQVVNLCNAGKAFWGSNPLWGYPYAEYNPIMGYNRAQQMFMIQDKFLFKWSGKVLDLTAEEYGPGVDPDSKEFYFTLWDGSYAEVSSALEDWQHQGMVQVRYPWQDSPAVGSDPGAWPVKIGDYVSVTGYIYKANYFQKKPPAEISSNAANTTVYGP